MSPTATERTQPPWVPRTVLLAALAIAVLQCVAFHGVRRDDAFITYRYAQNLATGAGLVFNPGERLMGSTSPGHVLLSALVYPAAGRELLPSVMSCLGCLGWIAQALALFVLLRRALGTAAALLIALAVALGAARSAEFVAMETNLVAALLLWAIAAAVARRWTWCAALAAVAGLFRPDMYLPALVLGLLCLWDLRARALRPGLLFVAISAPWYLFALAYFGTVLPQSASAKYQRTALIEYAVFEFKLPADMALPVPVAGGAAPYFAVWALALVGAVVLLRKQRLWLLPLFAALHFAAYLYLRPYMHHWHLYPANLVFVTLVLVAVASGLGLAHAAARRAGLGCLALLALAYGYHSLQFARTHETAFWFGARDRVYRQICDYLGAHARSSDVVASVEVGTLAYYSGLRMYDWGAIVTPHPQQRPVNPRLSWTVVDSLFESRFAAGMLPVKRFQVGDFVVGVHSFDLMQAAAARVLAAQPAGASGVPSRGSFEHELLRLAGELDRSGKPIDAFLRATARTP